jgi:hypothetical protein
MAALDGKWFANGDPEGDYYLIEGESYQKISPYMEEPSETGTWKYTDTMQYFSETEYVQEKQLELVPDDEEMFLGGGDFVPTEDGTAFFDSFNKVFYIRESAIGTPEGEYNIARFRLIISDWQGPEYDDPMIEFSHYGTFDVIIFDDEGSGQRSTPGKWSFDGETITLDFDDGTTEEVAFDDDSFTVEYYEITFE